MERTTPTREASCRPITRRRWTNGAGIQREEDLASVNHSVAEIDKWEQAHFEEDDLRNKVKAAKKLYEDACAKILRILKVSDRVVIGLAGADATAT